MSFTGQNVVDLARETLNDSAKARYTDASLLLFANAALGSLALLRPDLFIVVASVATVADTPEQDIAAADARAIKLYHVYRVVDGDAVEECDADALSRFYPGWMTADADIPENWMRHPEDPRQDSGTKYLLSPPPATGTLMVCKYAKAPAQFALGDTVPVTDPYRDALAHYIVFRAESKDDEHVVAGRAQTAMQVFMQSVGLAKENKIVMNDGKPT
jgi:hypothetical protein